ncbi:hypothetical protein [Flavobacteriaceae bacterium 14752]|uniref:hypothetical protein n=1 Tax=Mesohalobacter salilacus TaxID=2491711 RepID=UPI000F638E89|nr:hypothetical protein EIG84_12025 [Flavobacteriaceae bacterium 14752]
MRLILIILLGLLILFIIYIILKFILRNKNLKNKNLIIIVLSLIAYISINSLILYYSDLFFDNKKEFKSELWLESKSNRGDMLYNLYESNLLLGKTSKEVKRLIGNPDINKDNEKWIYKILSHNEFNFIEYELKLKFVNKKCVKVKIEKAIVE